MNTLVELVAIPQLFIGYDLLMMVGLGRRKIVLSLIGKTMYILKDMMLHRLRSLVMKW